MEKLPSLIHKSWHDVLEPVFNHPDIKLLKYKVLPNCVSYPAKENIFRVFTMPMEDIKVVILGQDPYPNKGQAIGYAFAVNDTVPMPKSLQFIQKEVGHDIDRTLKNWVEQGVFLLNTALTVQEKKAGSHLQLWQPLTKAVIATISAKVNPIWFLWGTYAKGYMDIIKSKHPTKDYSNILLASHPANEAYTGGKGGFFGSNHFNIANEMLIKQNKQIINW